MGKLFEELKRRKVFRVAAIYGVVAWLLIQVAGAITPALQLPPWTPSLVVVLLLLGFIPTLIAAWAYEITPDGIRSDSGNQSQHPVNQSAAVQPINYIILGIVLLVAGFQIADRFLSPGPQSISDQPASENTNDIRDAVAPALPETRVEIVTPISTVPSDIALSPDGRQIVFVASNEDGVSQLWLRSLATSTAQPLAGTENARQPFWSPDGRAIGFFADGELKRTDTGGGAPQTLATTAGAPRGGTWGADNTLLFATSLNPDLMRVSANGGEAATVLQLVTGSRGFGEPYFLPDGRRFLFLNGGTPDTAGIYLGALDGTAPVRLTDTGSGGVFHPDGWLLWLRNNTLTAQRLDLDMAQATLSGEPLTLADGIARGDLGRVGLSVANNGLVAYRTGAGNQLQLNWIDRTGTNLGTFGEPGRMFAPRLSPEGRRVAGSLAVEGNEDVWLLDGARLSRFTFDAATDHYPIWSPDGSRIVFRSMRTGVTGGLYQKPSNGAGEEAPLVWVEEGLKTPTSWSADGRFVMYHNITQTETGVDMWALPMTSDAAPFVVLQTPFDERAGMISPDGSWVAYHSNASGREEVYVRAFVTPGDSAASAAAAAGGLWQISTAGGIYPTWSPDGQELYYLDPAGNMMAATINISGDTVEMGALIELFPTRILGGGTENGQSRQYDVAADGRFLINTMGEGTTTPITLIMNWNPEAVQ